MDRKLKTWELALMLGVLMAVVAGGWLGQEQRELADSVIRFHVIANSDSEADQALKLAVRDRVLEEAQDLYPEDATLEEAQAALEGHLNTLAAAGRTVVEDEGYDYPVTAQLTDCWFPTKEYEGFALPAGSYTALRVTIVPGGGQRDGGPGPGGGALHPGAGGAGHRRGRGLRPQIQGHGVAGRAPGIFLNDYPPLLPHILWEERGNFPWWDS